MFKVEGRSGVLGAKRIFSWSEFRTAKESCTSISVYFVSLKFATVLLLAPSNVTASFGKNSGRSDNDL